MRHAAERSGSALSVRGDSRSTQAGFPLLSWPRRLLAGMIRVYQRLISPLLPGRCRFAPTCSEYAREALLRYGVLKGGYLGVRRLLRCHPWHPGGYDPVR